MKALVYHATNPTFGLTEKKFPDDYELVAKVDTISPDTAYELTNHIDIEWWDNNGVELVKKSRSTSMGDVIEIDGKAYLCEAIGWKALTEGATSIRPRM
jgi:hypothetical protein